MSSELRDNLVLDKELLKEQKKIKIETKALFEKHFYPGKPVARQQTPHPSKNINEVQEIIKSAIEDKILRDNTTADANIDVSYENPDDPAVIERVTLSLSRREPGAFGQGAPFESKVSNLRYLTREYVDDPEQPGYKKAVLGYYYDNIITLTAWARTNKTANDRALWIEDAMEEYAWWMTYSGIPRILFYGRRKEQVLEISNNKYYGRSIDYFVRTEKLKTYHQKTLEEICIRLSLSK